MNVVAASILIPTFDRAASLELAMRSALAQSVRDLEVIVIGDGCPASVKDKVAAVQAIDERVRFIENPKSAHHGEIYRHDAIVAARSNAIFYLCDDDLLLPRHVEMLLDILDRKNFAQSLNGEMRPDGEIKIYPANLADPDVVRLILDAEPHFNTVSITGSAHRRDFYLAVNDPWTETPPGEWPDHFQWKKLMRHPDFTAETSPHMTALQFPTSQDGRESWTESERIAELSTWAELVRMPDAQARIDELTYLALWKQATADFLPAR